MTVRPPFVLPTLTAAALAAVLAAMLAAAPASPAFAAAARAKPYDENSLTDDRPGGSDNRVVGRFQGSVLYTYGDTRLGKVNLLGVQKGKPVVVPVEGKVSNRLYVAAKGASPLEVYRNYRQALTAAGFETVYACELAECEKDNAQPLMSERPREATWAASNAIVTSTFNSGNQPGFSYFSGRRNGADGVTWVSVGIAGGGSTFDGRVRQFIQVVEPATTELGKVAVDARQIESGLKRDGKMALYGIHFDTDKAVLRDDSAEQLAQMAAALKAAPRMNVFIVGHTDNQGELARNTALSQQRAEAVAAALSTKYGIAPARLLARGVANLSPVSSNDAEDGRARNRRVEMVVR